MEQSYLSLLPPLLALVLGILVGLSTLRRLASRRTPTTRQPADAAPAKGASNEPNAWWASPLASDAETAVISAATRLVSAREAEPLPPYADLEMLRALRALGGARCKPEKLADEYAKHLRWRRENVLWPAGQDRNFGATSKLWPSAIEHAYGQWALENRRMHVGLNIGRSRGGHVVKMERVGESDISAICDERGGDAKMLAFYYSLLDTMMLALNAESVASGSLVRMYEIFDLKGLSPRHARLHVFRTMSRLLTTVTSVYAETTVRAVLLNLPRSVAVPVRAILSLLPERVADRVLVLGEGESYDFRTEIDQSAIDMMLADQPALMAHSGPTIGGVQPADGNRPGRAQQTRSDLGTGASMAMAKNGEPSEDDEMPMSTSGPHPLVFRLIGAFTKCVCVSDSPHHPPPQRPPW